MMDQGRGSSIPLEKGVTQNGNMWIPSTPDKPVLQRSNNSQSVIHQNQIGRENWHNLIDMYEDYLRNKQPHSFDLNTSGGPIYMEHSHEGVPPVKNYSRLQQNLISTEIIRPNKNVQNSRDVAPVEAYNRLPLNFNPNGCTGIKKLEHNIQNVSMLQKFRSLNQNAGRFGSYVQNLGEVVPSQKVNSLAEFTGIMNVDSNQVADASVGVRVQQNHILHGSSQVAYATVGAGFQQRHGFHGKHDGGRYNQGGRPSVAKYNLKLTPRSEARDSSSASRSTPLTSDQQKHSKTHRITQVPHLLIANNSNPEEYIQECMVFSSEPEILEKEHSDILANSMATSTAAFSTSPKDVRSSGGGNAEIDLNKTPQQKPPKRSKHRPKVIVEGKPKRSPRPSSTKSNTPDGNSLAKRKYVRRNNTKTSTPPITEKVKVAKASQVGRSMKSCKRKLNFDMENEGENGAKRECEGKGLDYQEQENEGSKLPLGLNLNFLDAEWSRELNGPSTSAAKLSHQNTHGEEKQQSCSFVRSTNKISRQESMPPTTVAVPPTSRDHALNAIARSLNARNPTIHQYTGESRYNQVHNRMNGHLVFQENPSEQNLGFRAQPAFQTTPHILEDFVNVTDAQGTMPAYMHTVITSPQSITLMGSQLRSHGVPEAGPCNRDSSSIWRNGPETCKKKNVEDTLHGTSSSMNSGIRNVEDFIRQIANGMNMSLHAQSSTVPQNGESRKSDCGMQVINPNANDSSTDLTCKQYINCTDIGDKFQQHHSSSQVHLYSDRMVPKVFHDSVDRQITKSLTAVKNKNLESASDKDSHPIVVNRNINSPLSVSVNKQTAGLAKHKKVPILDKVLQQEPEKKRSYGNSSKKVAEIGDRVSVDDITDGMKNLHITDNGKELVLKDQSALVPYRGGGAVVPYAESDLVKKRKPRPRVDLDPETNRLWNLLMGKEGGESAETMDTNKEKWWQEERKVFRGRVDSFIARMHLVQGDRRFSKWKGSVVDSVIGVFLTQNVSDHLSSSAFMSLAAKFPPKSTTAREPCREKGGSPSVGNHEVCITYPDGTTSRQTMVKEPVYGHSSVTSTKTSKHGADNVMPEKEIYLINNHTRETEEHNISSQSSSESFILQASEDVRFSSGSNSEAEVRWSVSKNPGLISVSEQAKRIAALQQYQFQLRGSSYPNKTPLINHQQFGKPAYRQNPWWEGFSHANSYPFISTVQHHQSFVLPSTNSWTNMLMDMQDWEENDLAFLGTENISTSASKIARGTGARCIDDYRGIAESAFMVSQDGTPKFQTSSLNHAVPNNCLEPHTDSLEEFRHRNDQHLIRRMNEKQDAFDWEGPILRDLRRPAEAFGKQPSDNGEFAEVETEMGRGHSSDKLPSKISTTKTPNAKKRKAEKEKAEQFNWDTLRKQVQSKVGTTGRSREAMDSLDYEALQNADVREISDTIKERGMNKMLADRMKNFLNRLVQDHERIDLEWLRDVEPDKSKDYLLSIQGLGLKSVECVRLLTLRHLAFPVDTNVGRIAVRLGWVPLQPLPESLQLHLLELYPVLETIQKYLWPRLCKLDQETLYELHYQMITFGKVFCTKREPNCNACPMRGECRHFTSAFASARFALPGPQERRIVNSAAPICGKNISDHVLKPMPLPPLENIVDQGVRLSRDCEPVIEEPTTPEPPKEVEESDIEDAFNEDPDEIPVIKLNIEEFTTNLQNFIQEHIEMGEGDMSKALVTLNPKFASIPTPKLKRISRLRTEHQVYELPDSHPLLKGMDRREPDDPSPYLLAIWTPGETADSVQAPESKCSSTEGGGLCKKETCFSCNCTREAQAQTVRGTVLIPCRTAMRGSFPLNGTYFQVNEVFADHESSLNPIDVPRSLLWNLPRRTVFFGASVSSIFKGLSTEDIQYCFWKGFVCVRGFEQKTRAPRPLKARLHFPASRIAKRNEETESKAARKAESRCDEYKLQQ